MLVADVVLIDRDYVRAEVVRLIQKHDKPGIDWLALSVARRIPADLCIQVRMPCSTDRGRSRARWGSACSPGYRSSLANRRNDRARSSREVVRWSFGASCVMYLAGATSSLAGEITMTPSVATQFRIGVIMTIARPSVPAVDGHRQTTVCPDNHVSATLDGFLAPGTASREMSWDVNRHPPPARVCVNEHRSSQQVHEP